MTKTASSCSINYAYHPSCAYHPRWECPLAPLENRLAVVIEAGEQHLD